MSFQHAALYTSRKLLQEYAAAPCVGGGEDSLSTSMVAIYVCISVLLIACSGLMAGLTLGLLSLDSVELEVMRQTGTDRQKWMVSKIQPVLKHPHYLMVTLLLGNTASSISLPIFVDRLLNPMAAILISVTAILLFGEILPQAVCKRYGLEIGAYLAWLVRLLMWIFFPIAYPIALLLDWMLGEETMFFRRNELKVLVGLHGEQSAQEGGSALSRDEVQVIQGALDLAGKTAQAAMTPLSMVFMLPSDAVINDALLQEVINQGHSRVPVYEHSRENIIGLILVKELLLVDEDAGVRIKDLRLREIPFLRADIPLYGVLNIFRASRSHMAVLTEVEAKEGKESSKRPPRPPAKEPAAAVLAGPAAGAAMHDSSSSTPKLGSAETSLDVEAGLGAAEGPASREGRSPNEVELMPAAAEAELLPVGRQPSGTLPKSSSGGGFWQRRRDGSGVYLARHSGSSVRSSEGGYGPVAAPIGIITIEDVLEELLQAEIVDETDRYEDNLKTKAAVQGGNPMPAEYRRFLSRRFSGCSARRSGDRSSARLAAVEAAVAAARTLARAPSNDVSVELVAMEGGAAGEGEGEGEREEEGTRSESQQV